MYTSGSTGVPKGVIVSHQSVNRLVLGNVYADFGPDDCLAHYSNPAFDASTLEIWGALLNGGRILIIPQAVVLDAARFVALLAHHRVTVLWITFGKITQNLDTLATISGQLRYLMTGGDVVDPESVRSLLNRNPPRCLLSAYGPTECTTFTSTYRVDTLDAAARSIPIGKPIASKQIYILDTYLQPVPIGATGEIFIGGDGVALGYLNRPELTCERFIPDPFGTDPQASLYKTGDLGRWRAVGFVVFLGRFVFLVLLWGLCFELGEF